MARAVVRAPAKAKRGEVIEIRTLISHPMETGFRHGEGGAKIPRDIINLVVCTYNSEEVFRAELFPAMAANPFLSFFTVATESGAVAVTWTDDRGNAQTETATITVE